MVLELPDLDAGAAVRAELGGGVADGGQGAQHQEFALGQGESAPGVEVAEAELGQEPGSASLNGSGRSARLSLISSPYRGACSARPFGVSLGVGHGALRRQRQRDALGLEHLVDRGDRVERARESDEGRQLVDGLADLDRLRRRR